MNHFSGQHSWAFVAGTFAGSEVVRRSRTSGTSSEFPEVAKLQELLWDDALEAEKKLAIFFNLCLESRMTVTGGLLGEPKKSGYRNRTNADALLNMLRSP